MESDLLRVYGVDLLDAYTCPPRLTLRRIAVLVRTLPADAATVRALHAEAQWGTTDYLLASVLDTLAYANWLTVEQHKRKGARNPLPVPVRRPGDAPAAEPPVLDGRQLAAWLTKVG